MGSFHEFLCSNFPKYGSAIPINTAFYLLILSHKQLGEESMKSRIKLSLVTVLLLNSLSLFADDTVESRKAELRNQINQLDARAHQLTEKEREAYDKMVPSPDSSDQFTTWREEEELRKKKAFLETPKARRIDFVDEYNYYASQMDLKLSPVAGMDSTNGEASKTYGGKLEAAQKWSDGTKKYVSLELRYVDPKTGKENGDLVVNADYGIDVQMTPGASFKLAAENEHGQVISTGQTGRLLLGTGLTYCNDGVCKNATIVEVLGTIESLSNSQNQDKDGLGIGARVNVEQLFGDDARLFLTANYTAIASLDATERKSCEVQVTDGPKVCELISPAKEQVGVGHYFKVKVGGEYYFVKTDNVRMSVFAEASYEDLRYQTKPFSGEITSGPENVHTKNVTTKGGLAVQF